MSDRIVTVRVERITQVTDDIRAYELVHPAGRALASYQAGAHIDVWLPGGFMRQYSLARAPEADAQRRYVIGVKREPQGRGGSRSLHHRIATGDLLAIGTPRNNFPLHAAAGHHLLLAGGIGITPLLAMAQQLARDGRAFTLVVFARSRAHVAFADDLAALAPHVRLHLDDTPGQQVDVIRTIEGASADTHLYVCGPAGFMQQALAAARDWADERVHREYFAAPAAAGDADDDRPFVLRLAHRGIDVPVAADQSALDALHDLGIDVPKSCEQGVCGTCVVAWLPDGGSEPEHRDHCLSATERRQKVTLCCSRARGERLVVGL